MTKRRAKGDGGIYERKDSRWAGQYVVETAAGAKRRYVYAKTRKEVAEKLHKAMGERDAGMAFNAGNLILSDYLDRWLNDSVRGSVSRRTFDRYEEISRLHIVPALGRVKLKALTPAHVQGLYRKKLDEGLSTRSVQYIHVTLYKALKQALRWGLVPRNVCESVEPPRLDKREITPLTADQVQALLKAADGDPLRALYWVAVTTGLRQGELLALSWTDVDQDGSVLRVRRTLVADRGKLTFGQPKTAKARRTVALTPEVVAELSEHRVRQEQEGLWDADGLVFCTRKGTLINSSNLLKRSFKPLLKRAGLPQIRFHDLRHTAATLMLSGGVHSKIVQEILGHAQITMTLDTYSHVLPGKQEKAVKAMNDMLE